MKDQDIVDLAISLGIFSWDGIDGEKHYTVDTDAESVMELVRQAIAKSKKECE